MGKRDLNGHHRFAVGAVGDYPLPKAGEVIYSALRECLMAVHGPDCCDGSGWVGVGEGMILDPEVLKLIERMGRLGLCP